MRLPVVVCAIAFFASVLSLSGEETAIVHAADGFQLPVGPSGTGAGYYIARGYRPNGHLGEDWNGIGGGDTDLGDPVYAAAHGIVVFARNYHVGWGNVVILRHAYYDGSELKYVDSLYGHLLDFSVQEGEQVHRGQQIGRIGNNFGMYEAHLHFEMRKNLQIGMFRSSFARDFTNYYTPSEFVTAHHVCPKGNHMVSVPINTFPAVAPPVLAGPHVETPVVGVPAGPVGRAAKISALPPSPGVAAPAPTPVFRTAKMSIPTPASTPEPAPKRTAKSPEATIVTAATPTPAPAGKHSKMAGAKAAIAAASPTSAPASKHGKKVAAAATPEPAPQKSGKAAALAAASQAAPTVKLSDDTDADAAVVVALATPAPATSSRHSRKIAATASPEPTPQKILKFEPVAAVSTPAPAVKTTAAINLENPVVVAPSSTPTRSSKRSKKLAAAAASPTPAPKKLAKAEELTADSMALPLDDSALKRSRASAATASALAAASSSSTATRTTAAPGPAPKNRADALSLIPEPIADRATPAPVRRTRRTAATPTPSPNMVLPAGSSLVVAPQPILPAPSADAAPVRAVGSTFKVDRYEDLRGGTGF